MHAPNTCTAFRLRGTDESLCARWELRYARTWASDCPVPAPIRGRCGGSLRTRAPASPDVHAPRVRRGAQPTCRAVRAPPEMQAGRKGFLGGRASWSRKRDLEQRRAAPERCSHTDGLACGFGPQRPPPDPSPAGRPRWFAASAPPVPGPPVAVAVAHLRLRGGSRAADGNEYAIFGLHRDSWRLVIADIVPRAAPHSAYFAKDTLHVSCRRGCRRQGPT